MHTLTGNRFESLSRRRLVQLSAVSDAGADAILAGQLRELKSEMTTIAKVTDKCRELESSMARKDEEIRKLKSVTKFTQIKELEVRQAEWRAGGTDSGRVRGQTKREATAS